MILGNRYYPESRFGGFTDIDGTVAFYNRINSLINPPSIVLDIGCGVGSYGEDPIRLRRELRILKGKCRRIIGADIDAAAKFNPFIDEFRLIETNNHLPVEDGSIDVCICDNVLEHVEDPDVFFSECKRVLKQGGYLCIRTPNILSYFGLFSKMIPNRFHSGVIDKVQKGVRSSKDVFPTTYKCNTRRKLKSMLEKHGFDYCVYGYEAEPSYLSFSRFFYYLGVLHQRFAPGMFKIAIFSFARKK